MKLLARVLVAVTLPLGSCSSACDPDPLIAVGESAAPRATDCAPGYSFGDKVYHASCAPVPRQLLGEVVATGGSSKFPIRARSIAGAPVAHAIALRMMGAVHTEICGRWELALADDLASQETRALMSRLGLEFKTVDVQ